MQPIHVIHVCDKFGMRGSTIHGASRLFAWWMPRFDSERFNVKLYALKRPDSASRALEAQGVRLSYLGKSAFNPGTLASFVGVIRREQADVLHLHGWIAANYGRMAGRLTGVPTIMHEHGVEPNFPKTQRAADFILAGFTHTAVAVSQGVRDFLVNKRFVRPSKIRLIYNGAPIEKFTPADPDAVASEKRRLGIPPDSPVIGTVGRLDTEKGMNYLLQSAKRVLAQFPEARFLIVGDGPKREELEAEARDLGILQSVVFTGYRSDVPLLQSLMDIQAFASLWEGTPLTAFEAMAMGKTIVSTNAGGLGEILEDGRSALVVPTCDPQALSDAITRLLADRSLADKLAANAKMMSRAYDISRTVRKLELLYEELCND